VKATSIICNSMNWHRKEQNGVDENKNLPKRAKYTKKDKHTAY